jgi:SOS response regulatory protein OraA/RecX
MYNYALKLLSARDYSTFQLRAKLSARFGNVSEEVIQTLLQQKFLNDRRYAENYVMRRKNRGRRQLREELAARGVADSLIEEILAEMPGPSLQDALNAKMKLWKLRPPLHPRDAARLFRALNRLGYDEDEIREAIKPLHEGS